APERQGAEPVEPIRLRDRAGALRGAREAQPAALPHPGLGGARGDARSAGHRGARRRYAKPALPKEESQYLIAVSAAKGGDAATVDGFDSWRAHAREPKDAWLWYQALGVRGKLEGGPLELARIARE